MSDSQATSVLQSRDTHRSRSRVKRKPVPPFPYSVRYPEPDPTDPFAPLSVLRNRTRPTNTSGGVHALLPIGLHTSAVPPSTIPPPTPAPLELTRQDSQTSQKKREHRRSLKDLATFVSLARQKSKSPHDLLQDASADHGGSGPTSWRPPSAKPSHTFQLAKHSSMGPGVYNNVGYATSDSEQARYHSSHQLPRATSPSDEDEAQEASGAQRSGPMRRESRRRSQSVFAMKSKMFASPSKASVSAPVQAYPSPSPSPEPHDRRQVQGVYMAMTSSPRKGSRLSSSSSSSSSSGIYSRPNGSEDHNHDTDHDSACALSPTSTIRHSHDSFLSASAEVMAASPCLPTVDRASEQRSSTSHTSHQTATDSQRQRLYILKVDPRPTTTSPSSLPDAEVTGLLTPKLSPLQSPPPRFAPPSPPVAKLDLKPALNTPLTPLSSLSSASSSAHFASPKLSSAPSPWQPPSSSIKRSGHLSLDSVFVKPSNKHSLAKRKSLPLSTESEPEPLSRMDSHSTKASLALAGRPASSESAPAPAVPDKSSADMQRPQRFISVEQASPEPIPIAGPSHSAAPAPAPAPVAGPSTLASLPPTNPSLPAPQVASRHASTHLRRDLPSPDGQLTRVQSIRPLPDIQVTRSRTTSTLPETPTPRSHAGTPLPEPPAPRSRATTPLPPTPARPIEPPKTETAPASLTASPPASPPASASRAGTPLARSPAPSQAHHTTSSRSVPEGSVRTTPPPAKSAASRAAPQVPLKAQHPPPDVRFNLAAPPTCAQLSEAAQMHVIQENGLRMPFGEIWQSQKTVVVFIRHFWCPLCQDYLQSIRREVDHTALQRSGIKLAIVGCGSYGLLKSYRHIFHMPYGFYTDPTAKLHEILGMTRTHRVAGGGEHGHVGMGDKDEGKYVKHGSVGGLAMVVKNALRVVMPPWEKGGDVTQLGGEFVLGPGLSCVYAHRMRTARSHAPIGDVLAAAGFVRAHRANPPVSSPVQQLSAAEQEERWMAQRRRSLARMQKRRSKRRAGLRSRAGSGSDSDEDDCSDEGYFGSGGEDGEILVIESRARERAPKAPREGREAKVLSVVREEGDCEHGNQELVVRDAGMPEIKTAGAECGCFVGISDVAAGKVRAVDLVWDSNSSGESGVIIGMRPDVAV